MSKAGFLIPSLDGIRAVSIIIVFAGHAGIPIYILGSSGVTIFFFLSGFLITTLLIREQDKTGSISLKAFYLRRALRILPPMYLVLIVALVLAATAIPDSVTTAGTASAALQWTNYYIIFAGRDGLVSTMNALWSLAVEEHFYLLFPLLLIGLTGYRLTRRRQAAVLATISVAMMLWRCYLVFGRHAGFDRVYLSTDTRADSILWGCVLALVANPALNAVRTRRTAWVYGGLPAGIVLFWLAQKVPQNEAISVGYTVQAVALAIIFTVVVSFPECWAGKVLNFPPVAFLGVLSYSFYLVHRVVIIGLQTRTHLSTYPLALLAFIISVAASYCLYRFVEQPCGRLRKRLSKSGEVEVRVGQHRSV